MWHGWTAAWPVRVTDASTTNVNRESDNYTVDSYVGLQVAAAYIERQPPRAGLRRAQNTATATSTSLSQPNFVRAVLP